MVRFVAVMGASGAGKTTFLNILSGHAGGNTRVSGAIAVNGERVDGEAMRSISAFVHQEDVILDTQTVREVLTLSAMLRLPAEMPASAKVARALEVAEMLSLTKSLDNVVGSAMIKGISGGEKRRLSLGMELITNPSVIFCDEPTSGLDSHTAHKVVQILKTVANTHGRTVVCTIHQPSSDIWHMFDDLLLLEGGQVMYHGPAASAVDYFAGLGYPCPRYTNPADFIFMDVLHAGQHAPAGGAPGDVDDEPEGPDDVSLHLEKGLKSSGRRSLDEANRMTSLLTSWQSSPGAMAMRDQLSAVGDEKQTGGVSKHAIRGMAPFHLQFRLLAARAGANAWRNPLVLKGKLGQTIFLSLIVGLIYLNIASDARGVQDRQGSLFFIIVQTMFGSVMGVLTVFGAEKTVFIREYSARLYGLPAYFTSRYMVELPSHIVLPIVMAVITYFMVGYQLAADKFWWYALTLVLVDNCGTSLGIMVSCIFAELSVAMTVMPLFLLPLMVFSGFFVNSDTLPKYFAWISYISPMKYGFTAVGQNEFAGLQIHCTPAQNCPPGYDGEAVLALLGFNDKGSVGFNNGMLAVLAAGFLGIAYIMLWRNVTKTRH